MLLCFATLVYAQKQPQMIVYDFPITRVIDGDTVAFQAPFLPQPLKKELSIRVYGVDTPEKGHRAKCPKENERGLAASQFTKKMVENSKRHQVIIHGWDKYGGRVLGSIILDGVDLRTELIKNGFAIPYFGEKKEHDWCK